MAKEAYKITIIGAGPYGLAAASHLRAAGFDVVSFGKTMEFWQDHMPQGMMLRSSWDASHISDPCGAYTLDTYQQSQGIHFKTPIPISNFIQYAEWFQKNISGDIDNRRVNTILPSTDGFRLVVEDGETIQAQRVIIAAGIAPFTFRPTQFSGLPASLVSHTVDHRDLSIFAGQRVIVVGSGQSAIESAALLSEIGAEVEVIAKANGIRWLKRSGWLHTQTPDFIRRLLYPPSDVGPPGLNQIVSRPRLFQRLPAAMQSWIAYRSIRPAAASWLNDRLGQVRLTFGRQIHSASPNETGMQVTLDTGENRQVDHILLATGYLIDIARYPFLPDEIICSLRRVEGYPILSYGMESSLPGLHFLGAPAAISYGPLMRFVSGTDYAARELTHRIINGLQRHHKKPSRELIPITGKDR